MNVPITLKVDLAKCIDSIRLLVKQVDERHDVEVLRECKDLEQMALIYNLPGCKAICAEQARVIEQTR